MGADRLAAVGAGPAQWCCLKPMMNLDLVVAKPGRLLLVEVKGRGASSRDGAGVAALGARKRLRLRRAWSCWLAAHPDVAHLPVEQVAALVPLPPSRAPVRWIRLGA